MKYFEAGTKEYKRASLALFLGGFVTFSVLYATQPLLPLFSKEFNVSATLSSLTVSLSTGILAIAMLNAAPLSDRFGKKKIMMVSLSLTSLLGFATAFSPTFMTLLLLRALLGVFIAGLPSIAMAYVGEEFNPKGIGKIMGLYISGTSIGGLVGRITAGIFTDLFSWRVALAFIGILAIILSVIFWKILPYSGGRVKRKIDWKSSFIVYRKIIHKKRLLALILLPFLLMGSFVTVFNYIGFMLMEPPYYLSQTLVGFIFLVNLCGTFSSVYMGKKADKFGKFSMLAISIGITIAGALVILLPNLIVKILGISILTFGFFASHTIASAWVGEMSGIFKAEASSLYLLFYYFGSSFIGSIGGLFWTHYHWLGVTCMVVLLLLLAFPLISYAHKANYAEGVHGTSRIL